MKTKAYPHVTGLYGDNGENPGALAIHAVLDPSPNYPESGRIIVGSPATTPTIPGYIANLGGFNGGPEAIEQLAATLLEAARDVRTAMGYQPATPGDLAASELDAAETLITTLERLNVRAAVDPDALQAARLLQRMPTEIRRARPIAKAAAAFVDEQGKRVAMTPDGDMTIGDRHDFAGEQFAMLVAAVDGGRPMKLDLDDLERKALAVAAISADFDLTSNDVTLALIARIRRLEAAGHEVVDAPRRDLLPGRMGILRAVLDEGAVLP